MDDGAVEKIGYGRKPDVRVRPHVQSFAGGKARGSEVIEEDERPDHLVGMGGEQPPDLEVTDVPEVGTQLREWFREWFREWSRQWCGEWCSAASPGRRGRAFTPRALAPVYAPARSR